MATSQSKASKIFLLPVVLSSVDNPGLFREIGYSSLRERVPDDIASQGFHSAVNQYFFRTVRFIDDVKQSHSHYERR